MEKANHLVLCLFVWQAKDHAKMRIKEVKSRLKQKVCIFTAANSFWVILTLLHWCNSSKGADNFWSLVIKIPSKLS